MAASPAAKDKNTHIPCIFQVIRNPSWLVPYLACIIISIGLLWQFLWHLVVFLQKKSAKSPKGA